MSHARCEHGTVADLCAECKAKVVDLFPQRRLTKSDSVRDYAQRNGIPYIDLSDPANANSEIDRMAGILGIPRAVIEAVPMPLSDPLRTLSEALAAAFVEARYAMLRRAFETHKPALTAALAVTILDYLPPDERENFAAFVRRMAQE